MNKPVLKKAMFLLITFSVVIGVSICAMADTGDVEINDTNFPDEVFRAFVKDYDLDDNDILSQEELSKVTEIRIEHDDNIADLTGIEFFDYTTYLKCIYCSQLESLDVSGMDSIQGIACSNCNLNSLILKYLPKLESLSCKNNNLKSLDVSECPNLRSFNCSDNDLSNLILSCPLLDYFVCEGNNISQLDISCCQFIKKAYFQGGKTAYTNYTYYQYVTCGFGVDNSAKIITDSSVYGWRKDSKGWWYRISNRMYLKDGMFYLDGNWYWFDSNGYMETNCWKKNNEDWYYLDANGACHVGWKNISGKWYYFDPGKSSTEYEDKGKMLSDGIHSVEEYERVDGKDITVNNLYYFDKNGAMQTGWIDYQGNWYYALSSGKLAKNLVAIDGIYHLFDEDGIWKEKIGAGSEGWIQAGGEYYYVGSDGKLITGKKEWINGKYYCFDKNGAVLRSELYAFLKEEATGPDSRIVYYIYFGEDGAMVTSEFRYLSLDVDNDEDHDSKDVSKYEGWYYFGEDGTLVFGSRTINGRFYSFHAHRAYLISNGWTLINENWYYYDSDNTLRTNWGKIDGEWYYFEESGIMVTGWKQIDGDWHYFGSNGAMRSKGWHHIDGKWYYLDTGGVMLTGWKQIGGIWYYFGDSGAMATGWKQISDNWYYFESSGALKTGWYISGSNWYYFNQKGIMATGEVTLSDGIYEFDSTGVCLNPYSPKAVT